MKPSRVNAKARRGRISQFSFMGSVRVLVLALCALCASAFVLPPAAPAVARSAAAAVASAADIRMDQDDKKAKAAKYKLKSSRSATKRFKVTSTGKLLRHFAGKAHLLRKKRPQRQTKLRRVGSVNDRDLDTYQRLLLVVPKRK
jgi:large subunit ribosomal protein L35